MHLAAWQYAPQTGNLAWNAQRLLRGLRRAARQPCDLFVAPECALTGYAFDDRKSALDAAVDLTNPGREFTQLISEIRSITDVAGILVVFGTLERSISGSDVRLYNSALVVSPTGTVVRYRKTHLPLLGADRFCTPGDTPYEVLDTGVGRVGVLICYDLRFPEPARSLMLQGADIIVMPTNWPTGVEFYPDYVTRTRALENHVFLLAVDRVGEDSGVRYLGRSQLLNPDGKVIRELGAADEELMIESIDPLLARKKHVVLRAGRHEWNTVLDRRPDLYRRLMDR